jgi:hypothetical protein
MTTPATTDKPRNPLVALVLGILCPGAGLVYAGWWKTAVVVVALFLGLALLPAAAVAQGFDLAMLPALIRASTLLLWGPSIAAGVAATVLSKDKPAKAWQHPWWVLGVVVAAQIASFTLKEQVVAKRWVTMIPVVDARFEPDVPMRSWIVVKRSWAPSELQPGAFVLLAGDEVLRVTSVTSGVELQDGRKVSPAEILGVGVPAH